METKQNPFSLYDFLGYFTPGALFLYGVLVIVKHAHSGGMPIKELVADAWTFQKAEIYIPFVIGAYVIGHVLNLLSSITIEKYLVWAVGYPSKFLLRRPYPRYFERAYLGRRLTVWGILLPVSASDLIFGRLTRLRGVYANELDPLLTVAVAKKLRELLEDHAGVSDPAKFRSADEVDFFRYAYHYAVENAPKHLPKMQNYVALYGFLRTLTLIVVMSFWVIVWHSLQRTMTWESILFTTLGAAALSYVLFIGFAKFYRRFSLEALMALAVTYQPKSAHA